MPDLVIEHNSLVDERARLQKLCMDEWQVMPAQVARQRQDRLWAIRDRLAAIEQTEQWKRRPA